MKTKLEVPARNKKKFSAFSREKCSSIERRSSHGIRLPWEDLEEVDV